mgnify:CR=1 FL=1
MDLLKRILKNIIFPNTIFVLILFPLAIGILLYSMIKFGSESIYSIISYALSFYALTVLCIKIPSIIKVIRKFKSENEYYLKYKEDVNLRINISLYASLVLNISYSVFQLCLGLYHNSFWFYSMAVYYILLSLVRFYLVNYTKQYKPGDKVLLEYKKYNFCGWIMLLMNTAVTVIIFFIIHFDRTFYHHQITTITLAAYTFLTFSLSIYNFIKYRKYNSPVYSAAKTINLICACVSMMTLTTTMLTTFGNNDVLKFKKVLLGIVGGLVSVFILATSIQIIVYTKKKIKEIKSL